MTKNFFVVSHQKNKLHQAKLVATSSSQGEQTYIQFDRANFKEKVVPSFLAADIPLHKLNLPALKSLFVAMEKLLTSKLASQKEENILKLLRDKMLFLIVDGAEVDKQKFINVLASGQHGCPKGSISYWVPST